MTASRQGEAAALAAQTLLAFDFGKKRVGVAVGNSVTRTSTPLTTLEASRVEPLFAAIAELIATWQPAQLVVGLPMHPDGQPHEMTALAHKFANRLRGRFQLPVSLTDERYSSVEAAAHLQRGQASLDALAASIILHQFFQETR